MRGHYQSNGLGEREFVPYEPDEDEAYERLCDDIEIQNAIDAQQMKLFPRAERSAQKEGAA